MSARTPAPWAEGQQRFHGALWHAVYRGGDLVALVNRVADVRLIAASPDLLALVDETHTALRALAEYGTPVSSDLSHRLAAALAKARGGK